MENNSDTLLTQDLISIKDNERFWDQKTSRGLFCEYFNLPSHLSRRSFLESLHSPGHKNDVFQALLAISVVYLNEYLDGRLDHDNRFLLTEALSNAYAHAFDYNNERANITQLTPKDQDTLVAFCTYEAMYVPPQGITLSIWDRDSIKESDIKYHPASFLRRYYVLHKNGYDGIPLMWYAAVVESGSFGMIEELCPTDATMLKFLQAKKEVVMEIESEKFPTISSYLQTTKSWKEYDYRKNLLKTWLNHAARCGALDSVLN
jgi:hypothetical protein